MSDRLDVLGIGNALVDVLAKVDDDFLTENGVEKGIMQLIDKPRAVDLYARTGPAVEISGGSGANTIAALAQLGRRVGYVGKVADDQLGQIFAHDIRAQGAEYLTPLADPAGGDETGRCLVLVTPDGERSMNTYLGASEMLAPADVDPDQAARADWLYLEGYRFDGPESHDAFAKAVSATKAGGGRVAVTLSDPFCVERHRDAFRRMIAEDTDLLFANEVEAKALWQTDDLGHALSMAGRDVAMAAVTVGPAGAWVTTPNAEPRHVPTEPKSVADATGAGDLFAAGFLHGLCEGLSPAEAARLGSVAAGSIITHIGARPEADLRALLA